MNITRNIPARIFAKATFSRLETRSPRRVQHLIVLENLWSSPAPKIIERFSSLPMPVRFSCCRLNAPGTRCLQLSPHSFDPGCYLRIFLAARLRSAIRSFLSDDESIPLQTSPASHRVAAAVPLLALLSTRSLAGVLRFHVRFALSFWRSSPPVLVLSCRPIPTPSGLCMCLESNESYEFHIRLWDSLAD